MASLRTWASDILRAARQAWGDVTGYGVSTVARRVGGHVQCLHCGHTLTPIYDLARTCTCGRITVHGTIILHRPAYGDRLSDRPYRELDNQEGSAIWDQEKGGAKGRPC